MTKIAFVISSLDLGGAQRAVSCITLGLPADYDIHLILNDDKHIVYPYRGTIHTLGIRMPENRNNPWFQLRMMVKRIAYLRELKKSGEYNAVISFLDSANIANVLSGKKCKTIISVRSALSKKYRSWKRIIIFPLFRHLYNKADVLVSLSEGVREDLIEKIHIKEGKIKVIYNGYDINYFTERSKAPSEIEPCRKCFNFITMGRLSTQKGQWHLIRAFSELYKSDPNIRLYILGTGELEEYLKELVTGYGLDEVVIFTRFIENPHAVLGKMDAFVFPSIWEGFGNALVEAMACGLPCISTDYPYGAREILGDHNQYGIITRCMTGEKYTNEDPLDEAEKALVEEMKDLFQNAEKREYYKDRARERAEYFSAEKASKDWQSILIQ